MRLMDWARPSREEMVQSITGSADMAYQAERVNRLGADGVAASAVIDALRPTAQADISGGQRIEVGVTITPAGGPPYQTKILQSFLPSQLEGLSPGKTIGVKYDPDDPTAALISTW